MQSTARSILTFAPAVFLRSSSPSLYHISSRPLSRPLTRRLSRPLSHSPHSPAPFAAMRTIIPLTPSLDVHIHPVRSDNFSYLLHDKASSTAAAVDPFSPAPLVALAARLNARISTVLCTHHHHDHSGGNLEMARLVPGVEILGSAFEDAPGVGVKMGAGEVRKIAGSEVSVRALHTPCHTLGHISFVVDEGEGCVFTGDTLFVGGCGRFFEGGAGDMEKSMTTLGALPDECLVFCGHEYTVSNLRFAESVDGGNEKVVQKLKWAQDVLEEGGCTVPSTIAGEKEFNPFMRTRDRAVMKAAGLPEGKPEEVMAKLREMKNNF